MAYGGVYQRRRMKLGGENIEIKARIVTRVYLRNNIGALST